MNITLDSEKIKYSKYLSTLFSTLTIVVLSILCLINLMSIDLYSMFFLMKIVIPAAICNWIVGYVVGIILENGKVKSIKKQLVKEQKAYEIPSIFSDPPSEENNNASSEVNPVEDINQPQENTGA